MQTWTPTGSGLPPTSLGRRPRLTPRFHSPGKLMKMLMVFQTLWTCVLIPL